MSERLSAEELAEIRYYYKHDPSPECRTRTVHLRIMGNRYVQKDLLLKHMVTLDIDRLLSHIDALESDLAAANERLRLAEARANLIRANGLALANHVDGKVPIRYWNDYVHLLDAFYVSCGIESNRAAQPDTREVNDE